MEIPTVTAYKLAMVGLRRWPWHEAGLKPYWGKPTVRNFRGGRGNEVDGLMTVCHDARKGRYKEVIGLIMFAPLLYSALIRVSAPLPLPTPTIQRFNDSTLQRFNARASLMELKVHCRKSSCGEISAEPSGIKLECGLRIAGCGMRNCSKKCFGFSRLCASEVGRCWAPSGGTGVELVIMRKGSPSPLPPLPRGEGTGERNRVRIPGLSSTSRDIVTFRLSREMGFGHSSISPPVRL
jgi:hypothetical protein